MYELKFKKQSEVVQFKLQIGTELTSYSIVLQLYKHEETDR